jgi:hypothetical protein
MNKLELSPFTVSTCYDLVLTDSDSDRSERVLVLGLQVLAGRADSATFTDFTAARADRKIRDLAAAAIAGGRSTVTRAVPA